MAIKEVGQSAAEVGFQADPGLIKNADGETVIAVTADEKVGIGTITPATVLDVVGGITATSGNDGTGTIAVRSGNASQYSKISMGTNANKATIGCPGASDTFFTDTAAGDLVLRADDNNSKVHIGAGASGPAAMVVAEAADVGKVTLNGTLAWEQEVSTPTAPAADGGGVVYVKADGKLYYISDTVAETELSTAGGAGAKNIALAQTTVTGTTSTLVGSIYLTAGTIGTVRALFGEQNGAHTASLQIVRFSNSTQLHLFTSSSQPAAVSTTSLSVPADDWYEVFMFTTNAAGIAVCSGIQFD